MKTSTGHTNKIVMDDEEIEEMPHQTRSEDCWHLNQYSVRKQMDGRVESVYASQMKQEGAYAAGRMIEDQKDNGTQFGHCHDRCL